MCGRCGFWFGIVVIFLVLVAPIIAIIVLDLGLDPFPRLRSINIRLVAVRGRWRPSWRNEMSVANPNSHILDNGV